MDDFYFKISDFNHSENIVNLKEIQIDSIFYKVSAQQESLYLFYLFPFTKKLKCTKAISGLVINRKGKLFLK